MVSWKNLERPLVLASGSPRRRELLSRMGFVFDVIPGEIHDEESYIDPGNLTHSLQRLARAKAQSVAANHPGSLVLGADTVVVSDSAVLGKARDREDAGRMLRLLSGQRHEVCTAVALECLDRDAHYSAVSRTEVFFRDVTDEEIDDYLSHDEYADKAGAYAIQGRGMTFVEKIVGCYFNVVGLPVTSTIDLFKSYVAGKAETNAG